MNQAIYLHRSIGLYEYEFFSVGQDIQIRKLVQFQPISPDAAWYNLAFGDWNADNECINDLIVSNNNDRQKVLATVAATVVDFTYKHPNAYVYAEGSTVSRTRLYQMGIASVWAEVKILFTIYGLINNEWEFFQLGRNYQAFLLNRK